MKNDEISNKIIELTMKAETPDDLGEMLNVIAYTIGGMVCHFHKDDRSSVLIGLTESLGQGLMRTAKAIGEPSSLEMIVGKKAAN